MGSAEAGLPGLDRREYFRARYFADVEIEYGSSKLRARSTDISLGGMLLETTNPLWVGAEFQARVSRCLASSGRSSPTWAWASSSSNSSRPTTPASASSSSRCRTEPAPGRV